MKLAVVVPVFNEVGLIQRSVERLLASPVPVHPRGVAIERTLILVDDGSTDGSAEIVRQLGEGHGEGRGVRAVFLPGNRGKGAAVRRGLEIAREIGADLVVVHDADLEYDPADHAALLAPILDGRADAVIGSRFLGQTHRVLYFWHSVVNRGLTLLSNVLTNLNLTDMECCLKAFSAPVVERLSLREDRFGFEPEVVASLARMRLPDPQAPSGERALRVFEVGVSYAGRTYDEGKKIRWTDGVEAIVVILRRNLWR